MVRTRSHLYESALRAYKVEIRLRLVSEEFLKGAINPCCRMVIVANKDSSFIQARVEPL